MRFRWRGALGAAVILGLGVVACSQSADKRETARTASTTQAIQGGVDDGPNHPYTMGICIGGGKGQNCGICTGTLVLPNLVITARHCVQDTNEEIDCTLKERFGASQGVSWVTTNSKLFQTTLGWHAVKEIIVPNDDLVCGNDIALIILNDMIDAAEATPVIPGVQYPMGDIDRYQHNFTAIGYGKVSPVQPAGSAQCFTGAGDITKCPGYRRIRQNISLVCIPGDEYIPCPLNDPDLDKVLVDNEFLAGDGTCQGDSGSGAFETSTFGKNKPVSFGVLSRGGKSTDGLTCKTSIYSRLDKWRDLVVQTAQTASANWTLYPKPVPDWTVYVPPPPDAGPPESGVKKPTNLADGVGCDDNAECASKVCADTGAGKACTLACDEAVPGTCYEGTICKAGICVIDVGGPANPGATSSTTTTEGCSVAAPGSGGAGVGIAGIAAVASLLLARRRRSSGHVSRKKS